MPHRLESDLNEIPALFASKKSDTSSGVNAFGAKLRGIYSLEEAKLLPTPVHVVGAIRDFAYQTDGERTA